MRSFFSSRISASLDVLTSHSAIYFPLPFTCLVLISLKIPAHHYLFEQRACIRIYGKVFHFWRQIFIAHAIVRGKKWILGKQNKRNRWENRFRFYDKTTTTTKTCSIHNFNHKKRESGALPQSKRWAQFMLCHLKGKLHQVTKAVGVNRPNKM